MDESSLIENFRAYLVQKRYVVVFDDVWSIDFWNDIKTALPDNNKGSRIIITTRNEAVAPSSNASPCYYVFKLQALPEDKAYELFCKKVFQSNSKICPSERQGLSSPLLKNVKVCPLPL